jgi:molybdate transport system substrate-binding protein
MRAYLAPALALCLSVAPCGAGAAGCKGTSGAHDLTVAAAASLRGVLPGITAAFAKTHPTTKVSVTYGASGDLRQEVQDGAPVDVVVLASGKTVDDLIQAKLAEGATRTVIATNALVLVGPKGAKRTTFATVDELAPGEKLAVGNPKTVPAGQYAETALRALGKWDALQSHLVLAGDVAAVLAYVRHGEVAAGIVYKTELHGIADLDLLDELPVGALGAKPEVVAAATTATRSHDEAVAFVTFLKTPAAQKALADFGFGEP